MIKISGKVIRGDNYGKRLGYPTANLDRRQWARTKPKIKLGVYAGLTQINSRSRFYPSGMVIGPKDVRGLPKIETHILNFSGNLYGKKLTLILHKYLRPYQQFKNQQQLRRQIKKDLQQIRKLRLPKTYV